MNRRSSGWLAFHGHLCPGLAMGAQAAQMVRDIGAHAKEVQVVAVVESDMWEWGAHPGPHGCSHPHSQGKPDPVTSTSEAS